MTIKKSKIKINEFHESMPGNIKFIKDQSLFLSDSIQRILKKTSLTDLVSLMKLCSFDNLLN